MLNTPVVLIGFNRPNETLQVFNKIKDQKPRKIFLISDGPRKNIPNEDILVKQVRSIMTNITWKCEVFKNFSENNMGCKERVSTGLNWVFSNVEEAIILEDDCLPNKDFFLFCEKMLEKYKNNSGIAQICGTNFLRDDIEIKESYYYSKFMHVWGWATWKDRWKNYDVDIKDWPIKKQEESLKKKFTRIEDYSFWEGQFDKVYAGKIDTWDHQWTYLNWKKNRLNIVPSKNLISNIGFGENATHTSKESVVSNLPLKTLDMPYNSPKEISINREAETVITKLFFTDSLKRRLWNKVFK